MRLRDYAAGQAPAPIVVMALCAREIELTLPAIERLAPCREEGRRGSIPFDADRHATRLAGHVSGKRKELAALVGPRRRVLPRSAADVDLLLEVHRPPGLDLRVAHCDALHAAVTGGARDAGLARLPIPQRFAVEQREQRRARGLVILHRAGLAAHELIARAALGERNLAGTEQAAKNSKDEGEKPQTTVIGADCVTAYPLSPVHLNSSVPLSVATVVKAISGLAAIAGCSSA